MSVREARLCDHDGCNHPAEGTCPLCKRDGCKTHSGTNYIAIAVVVGKPDGTDAKTFLGRSDAHGICVPCGVALTSNGRVLSHASNGVLSNVVESLDDKLIEAAGAFLAAEKLKRPVPEG